MDNFKIHVSNKKEKNAVLKKMEKEGIVWINTHEKPTALRVLDLIKTHNECNDLWFFVYADIKKLKWNSTDNEPHFNEISVKEYLKQDCIVIYREGNSVIAKNKVTGNKAEAKCHPEDKFDFVTGAKLAFDRLIEEENKPKEPEYYNGKVVCVENASNGRHVITKGKIYEFINGFSCYDNGVRMPLYSNPVKSLEELNKILNPKFIEIVE